MGITGLWSVLGDGEITQLAQLATDHLKAHDRPLRIAVDAAGWRFKNLNPFQVAAIREKEPRANPVEKAIFFRLVHLIQLGIEPLFVFDGPSRPWKHGKSSGGAQRIRENSALLRKVLNAMKVPHHEAPGEAEAECAALQIAGDSLMFGCTTLIRDYREDGTREAKSTSKVRLYKSEKISQDHGLDQWGLILFVILSGGDYEKQGLPGCGPTAALKAAQHGLGSILCDAVNAYQLASWQNRLQDFFQTQARFKSIWVPPTFPRAMVLKNYMHPVVTTSEQLLTFSDQASHRWNRDIEEEKLRTLLAERFNLQDAGYLKHIEPIFFIRALVRTKPEQRAANNCYKVAVVKQRKNTDASSATLKVRFLPRSVMFFGEDNSDLTKEKVECETLQHILRRGLFEEVFSAPSPKKSRKRPINDLVEPCDKTSGTTLRKAKKAKGGDIECANGETSEKAPKKRRTPSAGDNNTTAPKRKRSKQGDNERTPTTNRKTQKPNGVKSGASLYEDLTLVSDDDDDEVPSLADLLSTRPKPLTVLTAAVAISKQEHKQRVSRGPEGSIQGQSSPLTVLPTTPMATDASHARTPHPKHNAAIQSTSVSPRAGNLLDPLTSLPSAIQQSPPQILSQPSSQHSDHHGAFSHPGHRLGPISASARRPGPLGRARETRDLRSRAVEVVDLT